MPKVMTGVIAVVGWFLCKLGIHAWNGCRCQRCNALRSSSHHIWLNGKKCEICGRWRCPMCLNMVTAEPGADEHCRCTVCRSGWVHAWESVTDVATMGFRRLEYRCRRCGMCKQETIRETKEDEEWGDGEAWSERGESYSGYE